MDGPELFVINEFDCTLHKQLKVNQTLRIFLKKFCEFGPTGLYHHLFNKDSTFVLRHVPRDPLVGLALRGRPHIVGREITFGLKKIGFSHLTNPVEKQFT
jgi:hypothetical protein